MAQTKDVQIRIKIEDGQASVQIQSLGNRFIEAGRAAEEFKKKIAQNDPVLKGSVADFQRQIRALKLVRDNTAKTSTEFLRQSKAIAELERKQRDLTSEVTNFTKVNENQISSAGLAGATLVEFGRTISDLPFGINAITNNLSQLATLFVTLIAKTGGTTRALALLGRQLKGPLGIIIVFQILIAAIQKLFGGISKTEDALKSFTSQISQSTSAVVLASQALNTWFLGIDDSEKVVKALNENVKGLNLSLKENGDLTEDSAESLEEFIKVQARQALVAAIIEEVVEKQKELLKLQAQQQTLTPDAERSGVGRFLSRIGNAFSKIGGGIGAVVEGIKAFGDSDFEKNVKQQQELVSTVNELLRILDSGELADAILKFFPKDDGKDSEPVVEVKKFVYHLNRLPFLYDNFYKNVEQLNKKNKELADQTNQILFGEIDLVLAKEIQAAKESNFTRAGFEADKKSAIEKATENEIAQIDNILEFDKLTIKERTNLQIRLAELKESLAETDSDRILDTLDQVQKYNEFFMSSLQMRADAEMSIEERRTVLANNKLQERLRNERLSARERESINDQIARNEENLQKKRDKIAERQFKLNKAISIGNALISTFEMATDAFGTIKGMKFLGPAALPLAIAAAATATGFGLAQVDAIRRTQFVPSSLGGSGGGSGAGSGGGFDAPDFNIVGASRESQLARTIAEAESKPVRAFVVGKDITTQQELDRNVTRTASFG
jgi:hypothetical protein